MKYPESLKNMFSHFLSPCLVLAYSHKYTHTFALDDRESEGMGFEKQGIHFKLRV